MKVELLLEIVALKRLDRTGWVRRSVRNPESVAAHSWGVAWLVLALLPEQLDRERALAYAVIHDIAEVRTGDVTPGDGVPAYEKHRRERGVVGDLFADRPELLALWEAYEAQDDAEARFVRQLDRLDMALQAAAYQNEGFTGLEEFLDSAGEVVQDPDLSDILALLREYFK